MKPQPTPGPWEIKDDDSELHYRIRGTMLGQKYKVADVPFVDPKMDGGSSKREAYANALLIVSMRSLFSIMEKLS